MQKSGGQHGSDERSHHLKHSKKTKVKLIRFIDFKIIGKGYKIDFTRQISKFLFIKKLKRDLNIHKDSYKLLLFNNLVSKTHL